jgi:hypothetical protein
MKIEEESKAPTEMYLKEERQCVVLGNPNFKNIKLERGTKIIFECYMEGINM